MLDQMSWTQFTEWWEYYSQYLFSEDRADLRAGIVASVIANVNAGKGKRYKPADFIPKFGSVRPAARPAGVDEWTKIKLMAKSLSG